MRANPWTPERVGLLKTLWTGGATAQSIAERLGGVSRAAVLGKIFRLRRPAAADQSQTASDDRAPLRRRRGGKGDASPQSSVSSRSERGKSLLELTNETCRWKRTASCRNGATRTTARRCAILLKNSTSTPLRWR
jgi:hypothetical protein